MTVEPIKYLEGGDLRFLAKAQQLGSVIKTQKDFDDLFLFLHSKDRALIMRAADVLEKISRDYPNFLWAHQKEVLQFINTAKHKEFKWHLAQMVGRLKLTQVQRQQVFDILSKWVKDTGESRIVRVNALQALYDINQKYHEFGKEIQDLTLRIQEENIPSLNARIRKLTTT